MIDGILLIDKEKNITSYDVIRKLKRILPKGQKIGHAGTLDPFATGLLIVLLGKATKSMDDILHYKKEYLVKAEFGYSTTTQDPTGEKIHQSNNHLPISIESIQEVINKYYIGEIEQTPPAFSAVKINGKKAYELARAGIETKIKSRKVYIYEYKITEYTWPFVSFLIQCSSGTYVRTLINDLGEELKVFATAVDLRRNTIGENNVKDAFKSEEITEENTDRILSKILTLNN